MTTIEKSVARVAEQHKKSRVVAASPIYYGWIVLLAGTLGMIMTTPGQTIGVSVFLDGIISDLGLSRSTVSLMYTLGTLVGSFALPFVGRFIDRRGPRYSVVVISVLFALACLWMGLIRGLLSLFIGFVLIRSLGQGALSLVSTHVVNIWFVRRRGLAVGLLGVGTALGFAAFPILIEFLLGQFGWRLAYMLLGALIAMTILPLGALLYREHPERYGLQPDGAGPTTGDLPRAEVSYTLEKARRTARFWLFVAGGFCISSLGTGLLFHHYSIMEASGLDREAAALVFVPLGFLMATGNVVTGYLMDRVEPRFLLSMMLALLSAALLSATRVSSVEQVFLYGMLIGLTMGVQAAIQGSVYAYYFGRAHIGAIKGFASTISVAGAASGPFLFALGPDYFGGFATVLDLSVIAPLSVALAALFMPASRWMGDGLESEAGVE